MGVLNALGNVPSTLADPLAVAAPSPMLFFHYPLIATNVRILCKSGNKQSRGQLALKTMIESVRTTYKQDGVIGLYQGAHLHLLHQAVRDTIRLLTEFALRRWEGRGASGSDEGDDSKCDEIQRRYKRRVFAKYAIDALSYPVLLASTRSVLVKDLPSGTMAHVRDWVRIEGVWSLYNGMTASLLSTALDEIMDNLLAKCIDYCSGGAQVQLSDRMLLKASGSSVVSILTAPINYIAIIQRCQSSIPGLPEAEPIPELVKTLPWGSCALQFLLFGGLMAINVKLIQMKVQIQEEQDQEMHGNQE